MNYMNDVVRLKAMTGRFSQKKVKTKTASKTNVNTCVNICVYN